MNTNDLEPCPWECDWQHLVHAPGGPPQPCPLCNITSRGTPLTPELRAWAERQKPNLKYTDTTRREAKPGDKPRR